jgi:hypothetical protein
MGCQCHVPISCHTNRDAFVWQADHSGVYRRSSQTQKVRPGATYGEGVVWITTQGTSLLTGVDPQTNRVIHTVEVSPQPRSVTTGAWQSEHSISATAQSPA